MVVKVARRNIPPQRRCDGKKDTEVAHEIFEAWNRTWKENGLIIRHRIYWGWLGVNTILNDAYYR